MLVEVEGGSSWQLWSKPYCSGARVKEGKSPWNLLWERSRTPPVRGGSGGIVPVKRWLEVSQIITKKGGSVN